ncbi:MAG: DHH family phosphoesterase [Candidatus Nitrosocaldus sp.]
MIDFISNTGDDINMDSSLQKLSSRILDAISARKRIMVITHSDADGLVSGSIIAKAIIRKGGRCLVRVVSDLNPNVLRKVAGEDHDLYIITDMGAGLAGVIDEHIGKGKGKDWMVIDHHQLPEGEMGDDRIFNAWKFGIDGGMEACAGTLAYKVAHALDESNKDLSALAVVAMVADRQDQGERKSLLGLNADVADTARELGLLSIDLDLMLVGRETRAVHEALAYTSYPYIDGLTWNVDSCYSLLNSTGLRLKDDGRWRTLAEMSSEEKSKIVETIAMFASSSSAPSSKDANTIVDELIGYVYTLLREDKRSMLRDAREFSIMLNACARIRRSGVGIAICMGDRNNMLMEGEMIVNEYRRTLRGYISTIMGERWRVVDDGMLAMVNGDNLIAQDMLGAVSSLLSGSQAFQGRVIVVRTRTDDGMYKFSCRKGLNCSIDVNLGLLMRECSSRCNGVGGGHSAAAGARISADMLDEFMRCVKEGVYSKSSA